MVITGNVSSGDSNTLTPDHLLQRRPQIDWITVVPAFFVADSFLFENIEGDDQWESVPFGYSLFPSRLYY